MIVPDSVNRHPCSERVLCTGNRFGQLQPATAIAEDRSFTLTKNRQKPTRCDRSRAAWISPYQNMHIFRVGDVFDDVKKWVLWGQRPLQLGKFRLHPFQV